MKFYQSLQEKDVDSDYSHDNDGDSQEDVDLRELFLREKSKNSLLILKLLKEKSQNSNLKLNFESLLKEFHELEDFSQEMVKENKYLKEIVIDSSKEMSIGMNQSEKCLQELVKVYSHFSKIQKSLDINE
jgi:hypothetical protein